MPISDNREYRFFQALTPALPESEGENEGEYIVEGYASTFDTYPLFEIEGTTYYERIEPTAFEGVDTRDTLFMYNHEGRVFARTRNKTLSVGTDDHGLKIKADLSKTEGARSIYEDIKNGLIDRMSFAFTVAEGGDYYDSATHTRTITKIKKIYDVSAVSLPANDYTSIKTRSVFDGFIEAEHQELMKREAIERQKKRLKLKLKLNELSKEEN